MCVWRNRQRTVTNGFLTLVAKGNGAVEKTNKMKYFYSIFILLPINVNANHCESPLKLKQIETSLRGEIAILEIILFKPTLSFYHKNICNIKYWRHLKHFHKYHSKANDKIWHSKIMAKHMNIKIMAKCINKWNMDVMFTWTDKTKHV